MRRVWATLEAILISGSENLKCSKLNVGMSQPPRSQGNSKDTSIDVFLGGNCKSQFRGSKRRRHLDVVARDYELLCTLFVYLQNVSVIQF